VIYIYLYNIDYHIESYNLEFPQICWSVGHYYRNCPAVTS